MSSVQSIDTNDITTDTVDWTNQAYFKQMESQARKLNKLRASKPSPPPKYKTDSVLNLSSRQLTPLETNVLAGGFNFRPSLPDLPIVDYIVATEAYIRDAGLDEVNTALLRNTVLTQIEKMKVQQKYKPAKSNLSSEEWKALKSLQNDNTIMIIPADKGNKTVILDRDIYLSKLEQRTTNHVQVDTDPSIKHEKLLNNMISDLASAKSRIKDKETFILRRSDLVRFKTCDAPAPWNHGLINLHKDEFPLRDISDASQSPGHQLAKSILKLFEGYTGQSEHHLNSHSQLIDILKSGRFDGGVSS